MPKQDHTHFTILARLFNDFDPQLRTIYHWGQTHFHHDPKLITNIINDLFSIMICSAWLRNPVADVIFAAILGIDAQEFDCLRNEFNKKIQKIPLNKIDEIYQNFAAHKKAITLFPNFSYTKNMFYMITKKDQYNDNNLIQTANVFYQHSYNAINQQLLNVEVWQAEYSFWNYRPQSSTTFPELEEENLDELFSNWIAAL